MLYDKERSWDFFSSVCINPKVIQGVSKMLGQTSGVSFLYTKTKKTFHINTCLPALQVQPPCPPDLSPVDFYLWGCLKILVYSPQIENEEEFTNKFFMPVNRFAASLGPL